MQSSFCFQNEVRLLARTHVIGDAMTARLISGHHTNTHLPCVQACPVCGVPAARYPRRTASVQCIVMGMATLLAERLPQDHGVDAGVGQKWWWFVSAR